MVALRNRRIVHLDLDTRGLYVLPILCPVDARHSAAVVDEDELLPVIVAPYIERAVAGSLNQQADAVQAALEMFERLDNFNRMNATKLVLKVGIHRGDAIVVSGRHGTDYFGQTVNIASRIGAIAAPGEIVLSDAVHHGSSVPPLLAGYQVHEEQATLKGASGEVLVHRLQPAQQIGA